MDNNLDIFFNFTFYISGNGGKRQVHVVGNRPHTKTLRGGKGEKSADAPKIVTWLNSIDDEFPSLRQRNPVISESDEWTTEAESK